LILVVSQIEAHVKKDVFVSVDLHLSSWETVNEPIERIIFPNSVIDELGLVRGDILSAKNLACMIILQYFNLLRNELNCVYVRDFAAYFIRRVKEAVTK